MRADNSGTPKTLTEAIRRALAESGLPEDVAEHVYKHVKDFLSQRFSVAMCESRQIPLLELTLEKLWKEINRG